MLRMMFQKNLSNYNIHEVRSSRQKLELDNENFLLQKEI